MLRTSLRSVTGPVRRHVCLSCLARPGAPSLRQFHHVSTLRTELSESKPEVQSVDASIEPSVQASKNVRQRSKKKKYVSPMDIPTWDALSKTQRSNYKQRHKGAYERFKPILLAERPHLLVHIQRRLELQQLRSEATPSEASQGEAPQGKAPQSEAQQVETKKIKALQEKRAKITPEEAVIIMKKAKVVEAELLAAKLKEEDGPKSQKISQWVQREEARIAKLEAEVSGQKEQPKSETPNDAATKTPAGKPVNGMKKTSALNLKSNSNIVAQILESTSKNNVPSPEKSPKQAPAKQKKAVSHLAKHIESQEHASLSSDELSLKAVDAPMPPVPGVSFGLDRVLFNPGVYQLRDPRSRVYNFDPYLGQIMPVTEFDFDSLKPYITSSKDVVACEMAAQEKKKYYGSSSSMTSALSHFHYLLSAWRPIDTRRISQGFSDNLRTFTRLLRAPTAMFLHYKEKEDVYAIDADKEYDSANILMNLGKSMEKLLTLPKEEFERYRRTSENKITPEEEETVPESYHYTGIGKFLMRSQLDAYDPRLPGTGMFDLKTRAVVSIRMDAANHERGMGYEIKNRFGMYESYEREYFDMIRAAFLKYSLQVRVGRMDGIFVAYHNIERIFGFQYISLPEMDQSLHGQSNTALGDKEFILSLGLWEKVLDKATKKFPKQSLRFHFETRDAQTPFMYIFAQPVTSDEIHAIQTKNHAEIEAFQEKLFNPEKFAKQQAELESSISDKPLVEEITEPGSQPKIQPQTSTEPETSTEETDASTESNTLDSSEPVDPTLVSGEQPAETEAEADADTFAIPEPTKSEAEKPDDYVEDLLAMTLVIRSKINGEPVERPTHINRNDKWTVDYELDEVSVERGNELLRMCKRRRKLVLEKTAEEDVSDRNNEYLTRLRKLSEQGRIFRKRENKKDRERGIVIYEDLSRKDVKA
ncbi:hypothetical protein N7457_006694 [Penicillium paradoxum]|uniref:uncharacterized protein n=1 Tax=Penicillium paradoxum TaxID=176176 RepID=UPI002546D59A|nr:uncharacterized protein N7457_006694 [Penicillium paradoxum]KAJ5778974.1 hypothetical protein N7457_006694 [Penicillium paradoxum]